MARMDADVPRPSQIGRYEIIELLGEGGMASVYRAHDPHFKREVAVKMLPREFVFNDHYRARFRREAETVAALEHHAIVPVYDFGEVGNQPYLVMRLMTGGSLAERLEQGALPWDEALAILERIAAALERAHQNGVTHRDLKPENILFDQYDDAYLADFGIARLAESTATLTGSGTIGTPSYMSPEQIEGKGVDGRADIYALGILLYEMLTGDKPYKGPTPAQVLVKHVTAPVPRILDVQPELPPACELTIAKAMAKDPANRFQTATEMARALRGFGRYAQASPPPLEPVSPMPQAANPPGPDDHSGGMTAYEAPPTVYEPESSANGRRLLIGGTVLVLLVVIILVALIAANGG